MLDLLEGFHLGDGNEDNNGLLATSYIDLTGSRDLEWSELSLQLGDVVLEVNQGLSDAGFGFIGGRRGRVCRAEDLVLDGHVES